MFSAADRSVPYFSQNQNVAKQSNKAIKHVAFKHVICVYRSVVAVLSPCFK